MVLQRVSPLASCSGVFSVMHVSHKLSTRPRLTSVRDPLVRVRSLLVAPHFSANGSC